jgi:tetratricopeptide (TPR) repeat protein
MSGTSLIGTVVKVFYSYAHQDKKLRDKLEKHLSVLQRQGIIEGWHNGEIEAGSERDAQLKEHLNQSDIILLLISSDFIASDYCYCLEMMQALKRHERGEARVIPILLRSVHIQRLPFAFLQFLPMDGKPIEKWRYKDDAFAEVVKAISNVIEEIHAQLSSEPAPSGTAGDLLAWWKVPYPQNVFFTGRTSILEQLHATFLARNVGIFVQAINGLGGIGKTQIALEYVYRYVQTYQAVFWVAADPQGDLLGDFVSIAQFLHLPEQHEPNQALIVEAVKEWFRRHEGWLLLFDNVEDVNAVNAFFPTAGKGHILITTRAQTTGTIAAPCEIEPMDIQEGTQFLFQRVKHLFQNMPLDLMESQEKAAEEITRLFAGHPLALDQAGAYVEETGQRLSDYLDLYRERQLALLGYRGDTSTDHSKSVMTTFSLAFEGVERLRPDAAELLRFCAFLHPDALPEELLKAGALSFDQAYQGMARDSYILNAALAVLRKYSLIKRNSTTKTVSMHRLVQDVLKKSMDEAQQRYWAESVVRMLSRAFPDGEPASWPDCLRYLPHARVGMQLLEAWQMHFVEAVRLLNSVGYYLYKRGEYAEAQGRYKQALELLAGDEEQLLTSQILSNLGVLHIHLAHYPQAESYLRRALRIREQLLEPTHPDLAQNLNDLAGVYHNQRNLAEAEPLYQQALAIQEQLLGVEDPATVSTLGNLALLKYSLKKYAEAEELNKRVLAAREKHPDATHVDIGQSLLNLAYVYLRQQRYAEAEALFKQALTIYEGVYGSEHPQTMHALNGLGLLYTAQKRYDDAEPLLQSVLPIYEEAYGSKHPRFVGLLKAFAEISLYREQYEEAEQLQRRAWQIQEQTSWLEYIDLVPGFRELARIHESQESYDRAESLYRLMITIRQRFPGEEHQDIAAAQEDYASFLRRRKSVDAASESSDAD